MYILDEPSTGLHAVDVKRLIDVLQQLVGTGNTVVVIEHNLDVIKCADWLIDLGPEGGDAGGQIVAEGPPAQVAQTKGSYTGHFLQRYFTGRDGKSNQSPARKGRSPKPKSGTRKSPAKKKSATKKSSAKKKPTKPKPNRKKVAAK